ncbi:MAG TPA: hypothetical protein VN602_08920 [Gemmatimonadaceae bacterium]|nr:hypothetical protein [Gemmatimonadaceae bacterium]
MNQFRDSAEHTVDSCQRGGVGVAAVFYFRCSVFVAFTHLGDVGQPIEHLSMVRARRELRQLRDAGVDRVVPGARDGGRVDVESVQGQGVGLNVVRFAARISDRSSAAMSRQVLIVPKSGGVCGIVN